MKLRKHLYWGSHLPVLIKLMEITRDFDSPEGGVLELGTGLYSTPFLHYACFLTGRHLTSYEDNPEYYELMKEYQSDFHDVILVKDWSKIKIDKPWSLAFIDQTDEFRSQTANRLSLNARFVVLHDTQKDQEEHFKYDEVYPNYKYVYHWSKLSPQTSILSNFEDVTRLKI